MSVPVSNEGHNVVVAGPPVPDIPTQIVENGVHEENGTEPPPRLEEPATSIEDEDRIERGEYVELYREYLRVSLENEKYAEQLRRVRKVTRRIQKERRFLMKKLDEFGDDYKNARVVFMEEEETRMTSENQDNEEEDAIPAKQQKKPVHKKLKVKRLHNAPKKPSNAFLMFCQKNRSVVQEEHLKLNKIEIGRQEMTRRLAEIWKETSAEDKKKYYEMYEKDKVRYAEEMKKFESEHPVKQEEATSTSAPNTQPPDTGGAT